MIYFMLVFELSPEDIRSLKFENPIMKNNQASIKVYRTKNKNINKKCQFLNISTIKLWNMKRILSKKEIYIWQTDYMTKSKLSVILCLRILSQLL